MQGLVDHCSVGGGRVEYLARWVFPSLLSRNGGYFQLDANSGIAAAVVEMLLQSHAGVIHLGPALLPGGGSFAGWAARGGFLVDMAWDAEGQVTGARIESRKGKPLAVRVQDGRPFKLDGVEMVGDNAPPIDTVAGKTYEVSF